MEFLCDFSPRTFNRERRCCDLRACSYNIIINFREIWSEDANWTHLDQDRVLLRTVMNTEKSTMQFFEGGLHHKAVDTLLPVLHS
jgi:hypothetical protein